MARLVELAGEELIHLLDVLDASDSVELKLTLPEAEHRSTVAALGMDPLDAQIRQVFFFDTSDLALNEHGVVVRARRIQGKAHDSVVKLRPVVPGELARNFRTSPNLVIEVDAMPDGYVCSATMKRKLGSRDVMDAVSRRLALSELFSKEQRQFFRAHAPEGLELEDLSVLGPIFVLKLKFTPQGRRRKLVAEMWLYPDGSRILELSTKCAPSEAFQVAAEERADLARHGVDVSGEQQTKTKAALEFYSKELQAVAVGP